LTYVDLFKHSRTTELCFQYDVSTHTSDVCPEGFNSAD
jgi:hypothetical protein